MTTTQEILAIADGIATCPAYSAADIGCKFVPHTEGVDCSADAMLVSETRRDIIVKALHFYAVNYT